MSLATVQQPATWPISTAPWRHQEDAFQFAAERQGTLLAHGMGCGKSATTIALLEHDQAKRVLVLCPKSVVAVWPDQFSQHAARNWLAWAGEVQGARGPLRSPSVAKRAEALVDATATALRERRPLVAIVNYEAAPTGDLGKLLSGTSWEAIVLDESHRIKKPGGKASTFAARLCERARRRGGRVLALSGTPMPQTPLDVWAQIRALDGGARFDTSYMRFCQRYGEGEQIYAAGGIPRTIYKKLRDDRAAEFTRTLGGVMHRVDSADVLDLPDAIDVHRACELSPGARRAYEQLEKHYITEVGDHILTAANAMVLVLRLAQAANGFGTDADTGEPVDLDSEPAKAALLADVLQDLPIDEPVVVFARFHHDLDAIRRVAEKQGRRYGELSGRRRDGLDGPRMSPDVDVLGAQLQSGGVGIDLTRARHAIYYSLDFRLADHEQSRARLHRPGQERSVVYTHLLVQDTVDWAIYGALRKRKEVVDAVLKDLRGRA